DRVYFGLNASLNGALELLNRPAPDAGVLAAGASYTRTATVVLPLSLSLAPGNYQFLVNLDTANVLIESNEANNLGRSGALAVNWPPLPDLRAVSISAPPEAQPGSPASFEWVVDNLGTAPAVPAWV